MRSQSIAWLLEKYKLNPITLKGGYKIYRRWVLDSFSKKLNIVVIGGKTGTGKTRLLSLLEKYKYQTIDLEGFACHRGSTFGGLGMKEQPSNEQFENLIAEKLNSFKCSNNIFVEAESANIGKCKIPHEFIFRMDLTISVLLAPKWRMSSRMNDTLVYPNAAEKHTAGSTPTWVNPCSTAGNSSPLNSMPTAVNPAPMRLAW